MVGTGLVTKFKQEMAKTKATEGRERTINCMDAKRRFEQLHQQSRLVA